VLETFVLVCQCTCFFLSTAFNINVQYSFYCKYKCAMQSFTATINVQYSFLLATCSFVFIVVVLRVYFVHTFMLYIGVM